MPDRAPVQLDAAAIRRYLMEVAEALDGQPRQTLIVAGGSLLALHGLRASTRDVDSIRALAEPTRQAAATVAARHHLEPTWLNDRASMFWPAGLAEAMCSTVLEQGQLIVLEPPLRFVFVMKLEANRRADREDMRRLWPLCDFQSPQEAADLWHTAYPHEEPDPYLADYIAQITQQ